MNKEYFKLQEQIARNFGAKPTEATIIARIKSSNESIALEEVAEKTGYSLATISNVVRKFEAHDILIKTKQPGTKKIFVKARKNYLSVMKKKLQMIEQNTKLLTEKLPIIIKQTKSKKLREEFQEELDQAKQANTILQQSIKKLI